ncbi:MAG: TMEM175 family protein [Streptosporangiaceae bacterium]
MTDGEQPGPEENRAPAEVPDTGLTEAGPEPQQGGQERRHRPGGRRGASTYSLARAGFIEYDRVVFFSDAVFAIAITLLAVELRHPLSGVRTGTRSLFDGGVGNSLLGFAISFAVIGLFWLGHHGLFRYIVALDRPLIGLNLVFLGTIAFLPYPTLVLADYGNRPPVVLFYAASAAVAGSPRERSGCMPPPGLTWWTRRPTRSGS